MIKDKIISRYITVLLLFSLVINLLPIRRTYAQPMLTPYEIPVFSSVNGECSLNIYKYNDINTLINVNDIAELTRSAVTVNGDTAFITHGVRNISIDTSSQTLTEKDFSIKENICALQYQDTILVDAYSILIYLGASLDVRTRLNGEPVLICNMPTCTFWEAIETINPNTYFDAETIYGGKTGLYISLTCDILTDMFFGHGPMVSMEDYMNDALYEVLNVSFADNSTINQLLEDANSTSTQLYISSAEFIGTLLDESADKVNELEDAYETLSNIVVYDVKKSLYNVKHSTIDNVAYYRQQLSNSVNTSKAVEEMGDYLLPDVTSSQLDYASDAIDGFIFLENYFNTCETLFNLNASHVALMNETFSSDALSRRGYRTEDSDWFVVAQEVLQTAQASNFQKAIDTLAEQSVTELGNMIYEYGTEYVAESLFSSSAGSLSVAFSLSKIITYFLMYDTINAYDADLKALSISDIQNIAYTLASDAAEDMLAQKGANADTIADLKDLMRYYCLSSVALYKNFAVSVDEFGGSNKYQNLQAINACIESVTESYYYLSICTVDTIPDIANMVDNVFPSFVIEGSSCNGGSLVNDNIYRDIVLVLDTSGSMYGEPIEATVEAATTFTQQTVFNNTRIGLVKYNSTATMLSDFTSEQQDILDEIDYLYTDGMTNIYDALETADEMLRRSSAERKIIVLMSDGLPNESNNYVYSYEDELITYSEELKANGYLIYTLGFFQDLSGYELDSARNLLRSIASEGYYYDIEDSDSISFFFNDVATTISGTHSILVEIDSAVVSYEDEDNYGISPMPDNSEYQVYLDEPSVEVTVTYNGETLSSDPDSRNLRTSFGSLTFMGSNDEQKVLRLTEGIDYEITITGTDKGVMDFIISYPDETGAYTDVRTFQDVPISEDTVISAQAGHGETTTVNVDTDGNGITDIKYRASANSIAKIAPNYTWAYVVLISTALLALLTLIILKYVGIDRIRQFFSVRQTATAPIGASSVLYCANCGECLIPGAVFCQKCGCKSPAAVQTNTQPKVRYCRHCGSAVNHSAPFCGECGCSLSK